MDASESASNVGTWSRVLRRQRSAGSKRFNFEWCFDDGQCGFVVHKKNGNGYKMFLDSNEDGVFDSSDDLIVKGSYKDDFKGSKVNQILGKKEEGIITAKPYSSDDHDHDHDHGEVDKVQGINALGIEHMSFLNSELDEILHDHGDAANHDMV